MRKIIVNLCCSLDSFIEGAHGEIDWCFTDQDYGMTPFLDRVDTLIFGRHSYVQLLEMAPDAFSDKQRIIISKTLRTEAKNTRIIASNLNEEIQKLITQPGKDIWFFGGARLLSTFLNLNLIDEMIIALHPLILGGGKPLFKDIDQRIKLKLKDTKTYTTGLVQLTYEVEK